MSSSTIMNDSFIMGAHITWQEGNQSYESMGVWKILEDWSIEIKQQEKLKDMTWFRMGISQLERFLTLKVYSTIR